MREAIGPVFKNDPKAKRNNLVCDRVKFIDNDSLQVVEVTTNVKITKNYTSMFRSG